MYKKLSLFLLLPLLAGCTNPNTLPEYSEDEEALNDVMENYDETNVGDSDNAALYYNREWQESEPKKGDKIVILETTEGDIKIKLFTEEAPTLSTNFATLASEGKYDEVPFHRIMKGFMIQSGDYENGDGTGGESYLGKGLADEYSPRLRHIRGAVASAKSALPNSIGSQFYIMHADVFSLDNRYSIFGQVFEGMDTVDLIAGQAVTDNGIGEKSQPIEEVLINKAYLTTFE